MHIVNLIMGIILLILAGMSFWNTGNTWPRESHWKDLPAGRYFTTEDYENDKILIKDAYGNIKVIFIRDKTIEQ